MPAMPNSKFSEVEIMGFPLKLSSLEVHESAETT
jgi:hypothetical protein